MSEVTVIIPNWNGRPHLARALASLATQSDPPERILVVDNGSTDGSRLDVEACRAEWIPLERNFGFARAVNEGLARVSTPFVAIVNNDVVLNRDYLRRLREALVRHPADFATGCLLQTGTRLLDGTFDLLSRGATAWRAGHGLAATEATEPATVQFVPMTAALFRTSTFTEAGALDADFESYLEDVDFGLRCARLGKVGLYVPLAEAEHTGSATFGTWSPAQVFLLARNQVLLVAKHFPQRWFWRWGWAVLAAQGLWGLLAMRRGCGLAWLRGKGAGCRRYAAMRRRADPFPAQAFGELTCSNETRMRMLGATRDAYWRWYFRLAG